MPTSSPVDTFPHTLHSRHRQFSDPCALEQHVTFHHERHRVRYTNEDGVVIHDQSIEVKCKFLPSIVHWLLSGGLPCVILQV